MPSDLWSRGHKNHLLLVQEFSRISWRAFGLQGPPEQFGHHSLFWYPCTQWKNKWVFISEDYRLQLSLDNIKCEHNVLYKEKMDNFSSCVERIEGLEEWEGVSTAYMIIFLFWKGKFKKKLKIITSIKNGLFTCQ